MVSTGELRKGIAIELDGELWQVLDYHHIKMGRGSAQVRIKLRNVKRGQTVERTFQAGEKWPRAFLDKRPVQFLYRDGNDFHFMDMESYEQFSLTAEKLGDAANYLKDGMTARPHHVRGRDHRRRAAHHGRAPGRRDRARLRRRHTERRAQAGDDGDRPRRPGADLRRRGRHDPHRHAHRRVPDPRLRPERPSPVHGGGTDVRPATTARTEGRPPLHQGLRDPEVAQGHAALVLGRGTPGRRAHLLGRDHPP